MRDQRAAGAMRDEKRIRFDKRERLVEFRDPISTMRRRPIVLDYSKQRVVLSFPSALPMARIGVLQPRKNQRARHLVSPGTAGKLNAPSTASTNVRSSRRMTRLASAVVKLARASESSFNFFLYAS